VLAVSGPEEIAGVGEADAWMLPCPAYPAAYELSSTKGSHAVVGGRNSGVRQDAGLARPHQGTPAYERIGGGRRGQLWRIAYWVA